jgi:kinesin family protein 11
MTKRALIREYIAHIDRLKADLNATREKNGIFLSEQSYQMLTNENASFKDNIDEMAQNLKLKEEEMALISRKFKESLALYESTNAKLESSLRELQEKENQLLEYMQELERLNQKALEQEYLKKYFLPNAVFTNQPKKRLIK